MLRRNLKAQIQRDNKRVFLNLEGFAELVDIRYWREGEDKPPQCLRIAGILNSDGDMTKAWNAEKAYQMPNYEKSIKEENLSLFVALEDFQPKPRRNRKIEVNKHSYEITSVSTDSGMLQIDMHRLKG